MTHMRNIDIALLLFASDAMVLLALVLRAYSRRRRRNVQQMVRGLDGWAGEIDRKICVRLAELRELTERAEAAARRLTPAGGDDDVPPPPPPPPPPETSHDALEPSTYASHTEIRHLSDRGLEPITIARRLGRPLGEVELIIKLSANRAEMRMAIGRKRE